MSVDMNNPWHKVTVGKNAPDIVNGIIEIPKNTRAKYELDKETGLLKMDRVLYSAMYYPANYGFIPQTYCDDKDPLDILVLSQANIVPMCLVDAKVIGVMRMLDGGELDDKIIAVASEDMSVNHINDISQLPGHFFKELKNSCHTFCSSSAPFESSWLRYSSEGWVFPNILSHNVRSVVKN